MTTAMTMNTAASAQDTCAAFACAAMNNCMIIILDAALLASIFVAIISIIGTIPYGWRGVQNG